MTVFDANISHSVSDYLDDNLKNVLTVEKANKKIFDAFGIVGFFDNDKDLQTLKEEVSISQNIVAEPDRAEYGDFQTNIELANKIAFYLTTKNILPEIVIEPTCGKGNFILASLKHFNNIKTILGVEIYKPYVWECKFSIIDFYLNNPKKNKPKISIVHSNVFDFDFKKIFSVGEDSGKEGEILIIGNPPWVTNSTLGSLNSTNLPQKTNFKNHNGLDAITGKGNFDIAEYITLMMIETFQQRKGNIALLVKNTVIKNIVFDQFVKRHAVSRIEKHCIDSKKEFNVSVEAALFYCKLDSNPSYDCAEFDFYNNSEPKLNFGWLSDKFVSNFKAYSDAEQIDGKCPFEWRQGIKHDCASVMELDKVNGHFVNGLKEEINLEDDLVYGVLKSSDLKNTIIRQARKYTIVTQKKVGQETNYIQYDYPKTYQYLTKHQEIFRNRKSTIYKSKPPFSIFGIGDYSFKPYKVAISGLYKTFHFTLVLPQNDKPLMLDDTCYILSFDEIEFAVYSLILLNSETTRQFLQSITFADAKRTFTKDVLMRIDLLKLAKTIDNLELQRKLNYVNEIYNLNITLSRWNNFIVEMLSENNQQLFLFE